MSGPTLRHGRWVCAARNVDHGESKARARQVLASTLCSSLLVGRPPVMSKSPPVFPLVNQVTTRMVWICAPRKSQAKLQLFCNRLMKLMLAGLISRCSQHKPVGAGETLRGDLVGS